MDKIKYLSRIQLFQDLEIEELEKIEDDTPIHIMKKGTIITSPNEEQNCLYLIKSGKVRLYRISEEGKEFTVDMLNIGHIFGETGVFTTGYEGIYAEVWEDALICKLNKQQFEKIIHMRPDIALRFIEIISNRLKEMEELLEQMAYGSVRKRLLFLLYKLSRKFGQQVENNTNWLELEISITHQELATMMGSIRETVTNVLNALKKEGIVRKTSLHGVLQVNLAMITEELEKGD